MKTLRLLCCFLLLAASPAYAGMAGASHGSPHGGMIGFDHLDTDKDGSLSRDEFGAMMRGSTHPDNKDSAFKMIDTDGDGGISPQEWDAFKESHAKAMGKHGQPAESPDCAPDGNKTVQ